jgi:hypothetical protein
MGRYWVTGEKERIYIGCKTSGPGEIFLRQFFFE